MQAHAKATRAIEIGLQRGEIAEQQAKLETELEQLTEQERKLWSELCALFETTPARGKKAEKVEGTKASPEVGATPPVSLDDLTASVILMLRESPNEWFGVAQIAKALNADSKVVSKVIAKLDVEDNGLAKRAKKYRSKTEAAELDLE